MSYPVCVVCPECTAIYTPDVEGVNAELARENERLREALGRVQGLARTDGPAAPLLIRCDVEATVALTFSLRTDSKP